MAATTVPPARTAADVAADVHEAQAALQASFAPLQALNAAVVGSLLLGAASEPASSGEAAGAAGAAAAGASLSLRVSTMHGPHYLLHCSTTSS